jgi:farnesyl diphosphate synthase
LLPLPEYLNRVRARTEAALEARLPRADAEPHALHAAMRYATLNGGKRLRAALVYATGEALGARTELLDVPACALELIHAYSLVHDDLPAMDNDDLRRGKPTVHKAFDEATAILAGDALQTLAFEILAHDPALAVAPAQQLAMIAELARASGSLGMAGGQAIDLGAVGSALTLDQLEAMHARKTGALICAAVALGALTANAEAATRVRLDDYARAIGLAFQIVDDVLDVESDTATLGKPQGSDAERAKPTYPALLGLDEAKKLAADCHRRALESLVPLGDNGAILRAIADFIIQRRH